MLRHVSGPLSLYIYTQIQNRMQRTERFMIVERIWSDSVIFRDMILLSLQNPPIRLVPNGRLFLFIFDQCVSVVFKAVANSVLPLRAIRRRDVLCQDE